MTTYSEKYPVAGFTKITGNNYLLGKYPGAGFAKITGNKYLLGKHPVAGFVIFP